MKNRHVLQLLHYVRGPEVGSAPVYGLHKKDNIVNISNSSSY